MQLFLNILFASIYTASICTENMAEVPQQAVSAAVPEAAVAAASSAPTVESRSTFHISASRSTPDGTVYMEAEGTGTPPGVVLDPSYAQEAHLRQMEMAQKHHDAVRNMNLQIHHQHMTHPETIHQANMERHRQAMLGHQAKHQHALDAGVAAATSACLPDAYGGSSCSISSASAQGNGTAVVHSHSVTRDAQGNVNEEDEYKEIEFKKKD